MSDSRNPSLEGKLAKIGIAQPERAVTLLRNFRRFSITRHLSMS